MDNGVMDENTGKDDGIVDSEKIQEQLTTIDFCPDEVNSVTPNNADAVEHPIVTCEDVEMDKPDNAGMDIKEQLSTIDVRSDEVNSVTPNNADTVEHPVVTFEDADMDKGDDAGMDIQEQLTRTDLRPDEVNSVTPNNADTVEHPIVACEDADIDKGEDAGMDIQEQLTRTDLRPDEVNSVTINNADTVEHPIVTCEDADVDEGDDAGMDIDEVMGWKDEVLGSDATSGAEKDENFDVTAKSDVNVDQKLLESSTEPVLIKHHEEHVKSKEPIVYGRRAHVEVPLYESRDVEQKLQEPSSPVSEDEHLKIETYSEEEDDDVESEQEDELLENGNLFSLHQSSYFKPPENEGEFSVSDLVWGKVRSHPWWPGQIIDPSNASKKAMKYYKKDSFLVAYFGDHSFAWNSSSVLKPFRANFSQLEKQTDTEIFKTAVSCAVEEVSRRVELGLACSCTPKDIYKEIEYQVVENAGVRKKSEKIHGKDESASVSSFEPDKLVDYVRLLAQLPDQCDNLDLAIAKAQLSSYGHYKGHRELPEFLACGDLLEDDPVHETVEQVHINSEKIEKDLIGSGNPKKDITLSDDARESVGGNSKLASSSGLKKRKARVPISNGSVKKPNRPATKVSTAPVSTSATKVSTAPVSTPKPSFKIGEMIQKVASQLTGPVVKSSSDPKVDHGPHVDQIVQTPENSQMEASVADMLSQLHLTAQDPMKVHNFFPTIIPFFYERRAAVFSKSLKKPSAAEIPNNDVKLKPPNENDPEEFEFDFDFDFDDVNDSYWTDRIIQNHSEDQPTQDDQNGAVEEHPVVEYEPEKPAKRRRRSSKKQKQVLNTEPEPEPEVEQESEIDRKRRENLATEIVLKFEEGINFCSEIQLNKMFRRFGSLMESETEVDRAGGRARVVFKKCSDAEVAHSSAGRFNIFGSVNVNYELNYSPVVSYKPLPLPLLQQDQMDGS